MKKLRDLRFCFPQAQVQGRHRYRVTAINQRISLRRNIENIQLHFVQTFDVVAKYSSQSYFFYFV